MSYTWEELHLGVTPERSYTWKDLYMGRVIPRELDLRRIMQWGNSHLGGAMHWRSYVLG